MTELGKVKQVLELSLVLNGPGIMNYADNPQVRGDVQKQADRIIEITKTVQVQSNGFRKYIRRYLVTTNQLLFHLSLK